MKWTNSTLIALWNLGDQKKKKEKKNLTSKFYGFSTICKYVSFSKTTIHQALAISVSSFKNVACFLFGVHPWQLWFLSTNKKRSNNRTFVKLKIYCKFCKLAVFQSKDCLSQFYCRWTIYIQMLSTADHSSYSCPAHWYIPNDTMPENQILQPSILLFVTMIGFFTCTFSLKSQEH